MVSGSMVDMIEIDCFKCKLSYPCSTRSRNDSTYYKLYTTKYMVQVTLYSRRNPKLHVCKI